VQWNGIGGGGQCNQALGPYSAASCNGIALGFGIGGGVKESGNAAPYAAGQCTAPSPTVGKSPVNPDGLVCSGAAPNGDTCVSGGACVPNVGGGFQLCIEQGGTPSCPSGFTAHTWTVGTSFTDGRGCGSCTCKGPTAQCTDAKVSFFSDGACSDAGVIGSVALDGNCNSITASGNPTAHSFQYSANVANEQCSTGSAQSNGDVTASGTVSTICCQ
jgi:hypothetical protein